MSDLSVAPSHLSLLTLTWSDSPSSERSGAQMLPEISGGPEGGLQDGAVPLQPQLGGNTDKWALLTNKRLHSSFRWG